MPEPTITTIKKLFAVSSNRCAFPGCRSSLIDQKGALIGRVCHICADKPGGKRYDPNQTEAERQNFANLIVLCANHHIVVDDDEAAYTVAVLREMKRRHERSANKPFVISDDVARDIVLIMTGGVIGIGIRELTGAANEFARALQRFLSTPKAPNAMLLSPQKLCESFMTFCGMDPKGHSYGRPRMTHIWRQVPFLQKFCGDRDG